MTIVSCFGAHFRKKIYFGELAGRKSFLGRNWLGTRVMETDLEQREELKSMCFKR